MRAMAAVEGDPRPTVLVIGENNSLPFAASPSWVSLVADEHPQWKEVSDIDDTRTFASAALVREDPGCSNATHFLIYFFEK